MIYATHSFNEDTLDEDYTTPFFKRPKDPVKIKIVAYCTSQACTVKKKNNVYKDDQYKIVHNPPKDGWCSKCGSALFFSRETIK